MVNQAAAQALSASMRGEIIQQGDEYYDDARKVYNGMIDKRPQQIIRCKDVADVMVAVNYARENDLLLAIRGGGHNGAGLGVCDGGLVIDLSQMNGIRVDADSRTVRAEGGCTQGDIAHAAHPFGLAVPAGIVSTTGIGGLTPRGGHGYLTRKYGLAIDNLLAADMVLADGSAVVASPEKHEDLFWAIRGGGGNFGVVTSFLFRACPVRNVIAGPMLWHIDEAREVLRWYREFMPSAPEDMYGFFAFLIVPPGDPFPEHLHMKTMCGIIWSYLGPDELADDLFSQARQFRQPAFEFIGPMPFPALQSMFDKLYPPGLQWYWKGDFVNELSDEAIEIHLKYGSEIPTMLSSMHLYPIDGAASRVGKNDTAFSYRDAKWSMVMAGIDPDPANRDRITSWARDYWSALHPYSAGGAYVNFMMEEGEDRVKATYRENYDRLVAVKKRYDPTNLFRVNQNIRPD